MAVIQVDTEILKTLIKESVIDAIRTERIKLYESMIPDVSNAEMKDIINLYGEKPLEKEYVDVTEWFEK